MTFSLLDQPSRDLEGVSVNFTHVDSPSGVAVKSLEMIVKSGQLVVSFLASSKLTSEERREGKREREREKGEEGREGEGEREGGGRQRENFI